jgi:hypothetical protein
MSVEIKNTLFRMVTMRSPELLSDQEKAENFVNHPSYQDGIINSATKSFFKDELTAPKETVAAQMQALRQKAATFAANNNLLLNKSKLKVLVQEDLYNLSIDYAKINERALRVESYPSLERYRANTISSANLIIVWDNLFYQLITQKDPAFRDLLMHVLIANHASENGLFVRENQTSRASVVIPPTLFANTSNGDSTTQRLALNPLETLQKIDPEKGNQLNSMLQGKESNDLILNAIEAIENVQRLEKRYRKNEAQRKAVYQKQYDGSVKDAYANATLIQETFENKVTGVKSTSKEYQGLVLPEYDYEPDPELDKTAVAAALGRTVLLNLNTNDFEDCDTYKEVYELIDRLILQTNQKTATTTPASKKVAIIAGVPIAPAENRSSDLIQYTASLTHTRRFIGSGNTNTDPYLGDVMNRMADGYNANTLANAWVNLRVAVSSIEMVDLQNQAGNLFQICKTDGTVLFDDIWLTPTFSNGSLIFSDNLEFYEIPRSITQILVRSSFQLTDVSFLLQVQIDLGSQPLANNAVKTGSGTTTIPPKVVVDPDPGQGNPSNPSNPGTTATIPLSAVFIPSKFGVRSLGIADYRKVEQEICCYKPGEVSHIENIMAREYKEKSTERTISKDTTTTKSNEREAESLTDTTTATRYEMHSEVAQVLQEDTQVGAQATAHWGNSQIGGSISGSFAHNTSKTDSTNQAVTYAQDVTQRAMERVVTKTKTEIVTKVVETYKENNKHGFDNTKGTEHVSGVYRWINKVYNNQLVNYGKRAMVEFMIPEPAHFHILASTKNNASDFVTLEKPIDPRSVEAGNNRIENFSDVNKPTNPQNYVAWASKYGADVEAKPNKSFSVGKALSGRLESSIAEVEYFSFKDEVKIPDGYAGVSGYVNILATQDDTNWHAVYAAIGHKKADFGNNERSINFASEVITFSEKYQQTIPVSVTYHNFFTGTANFTINCELTSEAFAAWQIKTFNAIIEAYEEKLKAYNDALAAAKSEFVGTNPMYYRKIEQNALKKSIVHYLVNEKFVGKNFIANENDLIKSRPIQNQAFEDNASVTQFMEQAFEWEIMSYVFYPYYWGNEKNWKTAYNYKFDDALFTNFMQAGMARVILSVRPGFEKIVNWYMATGQVWNGGQVPTMGDDLFLSIDQEIKDVKPTPEGLPWKTTLPSDLTVIQSSTIGLEASGLPCGCPDTVGGEVNLNGEITASTAQLGGPIAAQPPVVATNPKIVRGLNINDDNLEITTANSDGTDTEVLAKISLHQLKEGINRL